jgi:hypothetical protein
VEQMPNCFKIFISLGRITTPDGRNIDKQYLAPYVVQHKPKSTIEFATEQPCEADWDVWNNFWRSVTYPGLVLPIPIWAHGCILLTDHRNGCTTITRTLYFSAPMEEVLSTGGLAILAEYQDQAKNSRG